MTRNTLFKLSLSFIIYLIFPVNQTLGQDPFPGNPPITPAWALKHWVWEDNGNTRADAETLVSGYLIRNIPVGVLIIDSPWSTAYNDFEWDTSRYPNPQQMIDNFHVQGVKVILWATGFVNVSSKDVAINTHPEYNFVKSQGYSVANGQNFSWWKGSGIHIDHTNAAAKTWWHAQMDKVLDMGIDGWKVDQGHVGLSDLVLPSIGSLSKNTFIKYYYADFYDYTLIKNPNGIIIARGYSPSGTDGSDNMNVASIAKTPLIWNGDYTGDFRGLIEQKNDVYDTAARGYGAPGVEVGGYNGARPSKESLIRYAQFAAMTPLMENGGRNGGLTAHLPWFWDSQAVAIYRYFATLHNELVPYNFSYIVESNLHGGSVLKDASKSKSQHKLGDQIFVSLITDKATNKTIDFPTGANWVDYWNQDNAYVGGSRIDYNVPLDKFPIFMKTGAIIPLAVRNDVCGHGDALSDGRITVLVYPSGVSSFLFHRPTGEGTAYEDIIIDVNETAGTLTVHGAAPRDYIFRVKSFSAPSAVTGATKWSYDAPTKTVIVYATGSEFSVTINGLAGYNSPAVPSPPIGLRVKALS